MKNVCLICIIIIWITLHGTIVSAGDFFVDHNNTSGIEDGTSLYPYNTIGKAVALLTGSEVHTIRVEPVVSLMCRIQRST